tara:strand:- start:39 stop:296 length:258 start_codon:yes stop_codon:yes gene_type:complete
MAIAMRDNVSAPYQSLYLDRKKHAMNQRDTMKTVGILNSTMKKPIDMMSGGMKIIAGIWRLLNKSKYEPIVSMEKSERNLSSSII